VPAAAKVDHAGTIDFAIFEGAQDKWLLIIYVKKKSKQCNQYATGVVHVHSILRKTPRKWCSRLSDRTCVAQLHV